MVHPLGARVGCLGAWCHCLWLHGGGAWLLPSRVGWVDARFGIYGGMNMIIVDLTTLEISTERGSFVYGLLMGQLC